VPELPPELAEAGPLLPALRLVGGVEVVNEVEVDGPEAPPVEEAQTLPGLVPTELAGIVPFVGGGQPVLRRSRGGVDGRWPTGHH
jgi:hypothetical protein